MQVRIYFRDLQGLREDEIHVPDPFRLAIDSDRVGLDSDTAQHCVLRSKFQFMNRNHRQSAVGFEREMEKESVSHEILKCDIFPENDVGIFLKVIRGHVEHLVGRLQRAHPAEIDIHRRSLSENPEPQDVESPHPAPGDHRVPVRRDIRMPFQSAMRDDRDLDEIIVLQRKVVDKPYTERQQERHQKNWQVSPADIQQSGYFLQKFLHSFLPMYASTPESSRSQIDFQNLLLLLGIGEILYHGIFVNLDFDIAVNLKQKGLFLDLNHSTVNTAYGHYLVAL